METKLQLVPNAPETVTCDKHVPVDAAHPSSEESTSTLGVTRQYPFVVSPKRARSTWWKHFKADERGAVTAEYAVVVVAAVAFAGLLVAILRSDEIRAVLVQLVENALASAG